ncbi:MAG: hypothetical protein R6V53_02855 [Candidatus Woesearchaeota archaeon]
MSAIDIIERIEKENNIKADPNIQRLTRINIAYLREDFEELYNLKDPQEKAQKIAYILSHDIHKNLRFSFPSPNTYKYLKNLLPYLEEANNACSGSLAELNRKHIVIERAEAEMIIQGLHEYMNIFDKLHQWTKQAYAAINTGKSIPNVKHIIPDHPLFKELHENF